MTITPKRLLAALLLVPLPIAAPAALAQEPAPDVASPSERTVEAAERQEAEDRAIVQTQGPMGRSAFAPSAPLFQLSTESGKTEVSMSISTDISSTRDLGRNERGYGRNSAVTRLSIQGFAPVDEDGGDSFVNLAEPLDGARIKVGFVRYQSRYTLVGADYDSQWSVINSASATCVARKVAAWKPGRKPEEVLLADAYLSAVNAGLAQPGGRAQTVLNDLDQGGQFDGLPAELRSACVPGETEGLSNNEQLITTYGSDADVDAVIRAVTSDAPTWFYGVEATANHKNFSWLDRTAFALKEDGKLGYEGTVFGGVIGGSGMWSIRASLSHTRSYKAKDPIEFCRPVGGAGETECLDGEDGAPDRNKTNVFAVEGRRLFPLKLGPIQYVGVAPEWAIDIDTGDFSVDVPIYFAPNNEGQLSGGVRIGYASEENEFAFGLFVGVPFTVFR